MVADQVPDGKLLARQRGPRAVENIDALTAVALAGKETGGIEIGTAVVPVGKL